MMVVTQAVITMKTRKLDVFNSGRAKRGYAVRTKTGKASRGHDHTDKRNIPHLAKNLTWNC